MLRRFEQLMRAHRLVEGRAILGRRGIYILPTRYGVLFAAVLLLMLVGSINYANNPGYLITFLLCGLGLVAMLHTHRNLLGLGISARKAPPVFAGEPACFVLHLDNPGCRSRFGIQITRAGGVDLAADLAAGEAGRVCLCLPTERRGDLALGRLTIHTRFPLGLLRAWAYLDSDLQCLVYPRPSGFDSPPLAPAHGSHLAGDQGLGHDDFAGLRAYRVGDPPRHVHWKSAARDLELRTKQYGGERSSQLWLEWEALPGLDTEQRLSRLCRAVLTADESPWPYGLRLPGAELPLGAGVAHRHACLAALARFGQAS